MFVVIGTTTVDLIVRGMPAFAGLGDGFRAENLVFCDEPLLMLMGGNGGNSAFVLGRLGAETALCSSIGRDDLGDWLAGRLSDQGVNLDGLLRQTELATSTSTVLVDDAENQSVFHHSGATDALAVTAVHEAQFASAEVLLASSYTLFRHMRAGGFARALELAHAAGGLTALDIGPALGDPVTTAEIAPLFPDLDYLIGNTHELRVLAGAANWEQAAADLLARGCRCLVVKRGAEGASIRSPEFDLDVPAFQVEANISAGAGDAFNAGFLHALWSKRAPAAPDDQNQRQVLRDALRFGNTVAALVVGGEKGVLSAPTLPEVAAFLVQ